MVTYQLVAISGPDKGSTWAVKEDGLVLGRDAQCDAILPDATVSRRHCRLSPAGHCVRIEDLGSRNPVLVNGIPCVDGELRSGDEIALGPWRFIMVSVAGGNDERTAKPGVTRTWSWETGEPALLGVDTARPSMEARPGTVQDLAALFDAGRAFSTCSTMAELLEALALRLRERFRPQGLWIALVRHDRELGFCEAEGVHAGSDAGSHVLEAMQKALRERRGFLSGKAVRAGPAGATARTLVFTLASPVVLGGLDLAVLALQTRVPHGAYDEEDLRFLVLLSQALAPCLCAVQSIESLRRDNERLRRQTGKGFHIVGDSRAIRKVRAQIAKAAKSGLSVLITGETGAGKELVARLIHANSDRHNEPFVTVNCAAIPRELFEGQLFGYTKGAFTGADKDFPGLLGEADNGTVFLDEVGDLSLDNQARILRAIELGTFRRLGAAEDARVNIRVVAATNKDVGAAIRGGAFREDFYHRLAGFEIHVPTLRERASDIPVLAQHFLETCKDQAERPFVTGFSDEALAHLRSRPWPGNVRQLRLCVLRALSSARENTIQLDDVRQASLARAAGESEDTLLPLAEVEKRHIASVLRQCEGNVSATAKVLQIGRTTLYKRMDEYGIRV